MDLDTVRAWLSAHHVGRHSDLAVAHRGDVVGLAAPDGAVLALAADGVELVRAIERDVGPRWVWWDRTHADPLAAAGVPIGRCWDVLTVHRLLHGGWRTSIALTWAWLHDLPVDTMPRLGQLDLLAAHVDDGDADDPVRPDGHLRPEWVADGWADTPGRTARWAATALSALAQQRRIVDARPDPARTRITAHAESLAEFLCAELAAGGLPFDVAVATELIDDAVGPRPLGDAEEQRARAERDTRVLGVAPPGGAVDLRNPADVKAMLRRAGVDVPDTRAWRLEEHRDRHPVVPALLRWRKAERIATTYGYRWLDEHVARTPTGGRLRGEWTSSDGAGGRMTASAGLHNLPAELRPAVAADPGHLFVRADLGQVEPRVLAAISGDQALASATAEPDLYQPVAARLGVPRDVAKVAVLGAMYGGTTGVSAPALRGLERAYPTAMAFLEDAAELGRRGEPVMTVGGRLVRMWTDDAVDDAGVGDIDRARRVAAARGRFARNAVVQGAAAEMFKTWAVTFRARCHDLDASIVLCLHDELLVHVAVHHADTAAERLLAALDETAFRWSPQRDVRFVADLSIVERWSDAK